MISKLASFGIIASTMLFASANAACTFRARSAIFPTCSGPADTNCPLTLSENTADGSTDDIVQVTLNFNSQMPGYADNTYFLLDIADSQTGQTHTQSGLTFSSGQKLTSDGSIYHTRDLNQPGQNTIDCTEAGCKVTYFVSVLLGAAPACTGYDTVDYVYTRAVYKFKIEQQWLRVNGLVDMTDWANSRTSTAFITQEDEVKAVVSYAAENLQVVDAFTIASYLDIVDTSDTAASICLGDGTLISASFSEDYNSTQSEPSVSHDNGLTLCNARAYAYMIQTPGSGSSSGAADDTDTLSTNHDDYDDSGSVGIKLSQFSQASLDVGEDCGGEQSAASAPTSFSIHASDASACASGSDWRWDVASASSSVSTAGTDPTQSVTVATSLTHDSTNFHAACLNGGAPVSSGTGPTSLGNGGTDRVRALAAIKYTLKAPAAPAGANQSPAIYLGAYYTHSIPTEADYDVDHDDYEAPAGTAYSPTARRLLRSAASKKLASPKKMARMHLMHARFVNHI